MAAWHVVRPIYDEREGTVAECYRDDIDGGNHELHEPHWFIMTKAVEGQETGSPTVCVAWCRGLRVAV